MELVIAIINFILAKGLNHHQIKEFLYEIAKENNEQRNLRLGDEFKLQLSDRSCVILAP